MWPVKDRLSWVPTVPLLVLALLTGHTLGYRLAVSDPHARAHVLQASGHSYLEYAPLVVAIGLTLVAAAFVSRVRAALRGQTASGAPPWLVALLAPVAFLVQEYVERLIESGHVHPARIAEPAVLNGLLLQVPLAVVALAVAWFLAQLAGEIGRALAGELTAPVTESLLPLPVAPVGSPAVRISARGWSERGPPCSSC